MLNIKTSSLNHTEDHMIHVSDKKFDDLSSDKLKCLYVLRKKTFYDRLKWQVSCELNMEFDKYDNSNTKYILGELKGDILFGVRLIELNNDNMISEVFSPYFDDINIPFGNFIEASRLFIDKDVTKKHNLFGKGLSLILFISMINFVRKSQYEAMYSIVSKQMYTIFKRAQWNVKIISEGISEKNETIYFIAMPTNQENIYNLINKLMMTSNVDEKKLTEWPIAIDPDLLVGG
ncbi:acyl homoserine lactone synthase [Izhakiella capsodis]|uniref:Acyl-homoserine-lactone synthase n=1 Tax=Izhakiella capsodis TaxID=1367852 RepID=A0A1I4V8R6_9GAMM|nr:acyl-homoserine-lactone synthase [Izhakiella capsodis]SFM97545.1 acyl homoserine lactone synthase [Izhakiella capsodis]